MIAAFRSGMGSLVNQWFGRSFTRTGPRRAKDRQEARVHPRMRLGAHAAVAMRRFTALALDPAALVLGDLELQAKYLPRRPSLLPRLVSAINSDASMRSMARIIGEDGTLLGGILQLANSSFYRASGAKPIDNLERAVSLLGTDGLRSLVATALLHPVMTGTRGPFSSFAEFTWEHGQYAAACAELHAARIERTDAFSARLLVLLLGLASNTVFRI